MPYSGGKRGRGRPKVKKEEICEDYCFICKDGGLLLVCDFKHCLKAYHTHCVGKDEKFIETGRRWTCSWHSCFICKKSSAFHCIACPSAVCKGCIKSAEFVHVRGKTGFCANCLNLAVLIEQNVDVDSDGGKVDFKDRATYEFLFKEYWEIINEKEGLTWEDLRSANIRLKKGQIFKNESDSDKFAEGEEDEEDQDFADSMDGKVDIEPCSFMGKEPKVFSPRKHSRKLKPKKREFIGWGSKSLRDFLKSIGKDSDNPISQNEVNGIIQKYIQEKKLTHPEKKKKVLCDTDLQSIFGRKSVNRNKTYDLLERHFAENLEESEEDEWSYNSDEKDDGITMNCKRQRRTGLSRRTEEKEKVLETPKSCFASVTAKNIKLVYLKRSLIEEFLKKPATFDDKVMGSFVRIRSDPNDYFQKNAYQLLQVTGITKAQGTDNIKEEVTLHVSNKKNFQICMLSDEDFSEEEIEDLHQRVKDGLLKKLTVVELEEKARSLHEDLTEHWIKKELVHLQNLSDRANEKGWRRELFEYMERMQLLQTPAEKQRLRQEVPKIIAEEIEVEVTILDLPKDENPVQDNSPRSILPVIVDNIAGTEDAICVDADIEVMPDLAAIEVNGDDTNVKAANKIAEGIEDANSANADIEVMPDLSMIEVNGDDSDKNDAGKEAEGIEDAISIKADSEVIPDLSLIQVNGDDTNKEAAQKIIEGTGGALVVSKQDGIAFNFVVRDFPDNKDGTNINSVMPNLTAAYQNEMMDTIDERATELEREGNVGATFKVSEQDESGKHLSLQVNVQSSGETKVIVLYENKVDQGNGNGEASNAELIDLDSDDEENPNNEIWHYIDPYGETRGPFTMSALRKWSDKGFFDSEFKVWKTGQTNKEAVFLNDALSRMFPEYRHKRNLL